MPTRHAGDKPSSTPTPSTTAACWRACTRTSRTAPTKLIHSRAMWPSWNRNSRTARRPRMTPITAFTSRFTATGRRGQEDRRRLQQRTAGNRGRNQDNLVKKLETIKQDATAKEAAAADTGQERERSGATEGEEKSRSLARAINEIDQQEMESPRVKSPGSACRTRWSGSTAAGPTPCSGRRSSPSTRPTRRIAAKAVKKGTVEVTRIEGDHIGPGPHPRRQARRSDHGRRQGLHPALVAGPAEPLCPDRDHEPRRRRPQPAQRRSRTDQPEWRRGRLRVGRAGPQARRRSRPTPASSWLAMPPTRARRSS